MMFERMQCGVMIGRYVLTLALQREWLGVAEGGKIFLEPVSIPRTSSLIGTLSLELDFNKVPK